MIISEQLTGSVWLGHIHRSRGIIGGFASFCKCLVRKRISAVRRDDASQVAAIRNGVSRQRISKRIAHAPLVDNICQPACIGKVVVVIRTTLISEGRLAPKRVLDFLQLQNTVGGGTIIRLCIGPAIGIDDVGERIHVIHLGRIASVGNRNFRVA